ncbi:arylsulfatase B-like [Uloborus diversus]|uniref:arylsulfatase B-like n=1 Tax=Uloborus diversus TaxID=327109 RepID=UPI002409C7A0|nr:arylsulfatase B-like [Uloborus diversus]
MLKTFLTLVLLPVFLTFPGFSECRLPKQPHIIFILADDLGWNDVSFHGSQQIPTPNIDALAKDGVILNNYYVQPICTPSRAALMTGKYPIKLGLQHYVISVNSPYGLPPNETILPQYLKQLGYATHGVGKWHLGFFKNEYLPVNRGFDSFFGYWSGFEDYFTHIAQEDDVFGLDFHDNNEDEWGYFETYGTEIFTKKAVDIIQSHDPQQPLFLYFSHQAVHVGREEEPFQAPEEYINRFSHINDPERRIFAGMASAMDDSIGEVFSALDKAGMLDDSIIIFSTDNGAEVAAVNNATGSNFPLRGAKFTLLEGAIRGTAFVWSRFLRNMRKVSNELMHITDWLPTLLALAGGNPAELQDIDGFNQWSSICCGGTSKRNEILLNIDPKWKIDGIRKGKYKLVKGTCFDGLLDTWFNKEGKPTYGDDFTEDELKMHKQVYKESAQKSLIQRILLKNYGKKSFDHFCSPPINFQKNSQKTGKYIRTCDEKHDKFEENIGNCICPVIVDCGCNVFRECNLDLEACLFNVEEDPCEYNNIAAFEPEIVAELKETLEYYRLKSVPIANQPIDSCANPKYHGYSWVPWKSKTSCNDKFE